MSIIRFAVTQETRVENCSQKSGLLFFIPDIL
jgi:hypothetical protein